MLDGRSDSVEQLSHLPRQLWCDHCRDMDTVLLIAFLNDPPSLTQHRNQPALRLGKNPLEPLFSFVQNRPDSS